MLLKDKLAGRRLILASSSPRRRQILADAGLPFEVAAPFECDEVWPASLPAAEVAGYLAALKSDSFPVPLLPGDILLTADTTVVLDEKVLGKPRDRAEAIEMLTELSGRAHEVITGVTLRSHSTDGESRHAKNGGDRRVEFSATSRVWFRRLAREEIEHYVDTCRPMDKAGAYAIQEWIGHVGCERIEGSFYNVMGLPIQMVYTKLNEMI